MIICGKQFKVLIHKKPIKHLYVRVLDDLTIYVTSSFSFSNTFIEDYLSKNEKALKEMIERKEKELKPIYLGKEYFLKEGSFKITEDTIYLPKDISFKEFLDKASRNYLEERFSKLNLFDKSYTLKLRWMKTKWGVCNNTKKTITLNKALMKKNKEEIDYVIYHELCHIKYPNHGKNFWREVEKYVKNYEEVKRGLND